MALWGKKLDGEESPADPSHDSAARRGESELAGELAATLDRLGRTLDETNRRVVDYLAMRESQSARVDGELVQQLTGTIEAISAKLEAAPAAADVGRSGSPAAPAATAGDDASLAGAVKPLEQRLAQIESTILAWAEHTEKRAGPEQSLVDAVAQLGQRIDQQQQSLTGSLGHVWQRLDDGLREIAARLQPAQPEEPPQPPVSHREWEQALLGPEIALRPELSEVREQFLNELLRGDAGARALAGQLLVFQSTPMERMAQLLKDVGEAYYRWRPKVRPDTAPMEKALVAWLEGRCDEAGIGNRIELVEPGQRFDATRHSAAARGVEITEVLGWIVLRDNGRVYTKAAVAVR